MSELSHVCLISMWALFNATKLSIKGIGATFVIVFSLSSPTQYMDRVCMCAFFVCIWKLDVCVNTFCRMRNVPVLLRERKRCHGYPLGCRAVFEGGRLKWNSANAPQCGSVFVFTSAKHVCMKDSLPRATFYAALSSGDVVECACVMMGLGVDAGWRKPRTDVSGADIERKREKKYILLVVLAVKAWKKLCRAVLCVFLILV